MTYSPQGLGIVTQGTSQIGKFISTHGTTGDVIIPDSDKFSFGTGSDASIYFDATNLVIESSVSGKFKVVLIIDS
mgnify:CR=1 FL=1